MNFVSEGPGAIPLWINGHAFLTVCERYFDVTNPQSGEIVHRVPLAGAEEALQAVASAKSAESAWAESGLAARRNFLHQLAAALDQFAEHFAALLMNETGFDSARATAEVSAAIAALRGTAVGETGIVALVIDSSRPLAGLAEAAAPAWMAGAVLVIKPSPRAPSAAYALCELSAHADWPGGVLNLLQGDTEAIAGLCAADIDRLVYVGEASLGDQVGALARSSGKYFELHS
jgi:acyl-CoA reductase-like NAD-dependent aldehyde dehydrogenase